MQKSRCTLLLYAEIRRNQSMARLATEAWQRNYYLEVAEALTLAANAVNGKGVGVWSKLVTRCGLSLHRERTRCQTGPRERET